VSGQKTAIVTGSGRGIGRAIAYELATNGIDVMVVARTEPELQATAEMIEQEGGQAWIYPADLAARTQRAAVVQAAIEHWGRIDVLVNNAGIAERQPFLSTTRTGWDRVLELNLSSVFELSQLVAEHMATRRAGVILHNASIDALGADGPFVSYNTSKAALLGLTRTMAVELAPLGIRVNAVSPGFVETEMTASHRSPEVMTYLRTAFARVPLGRLIEPKEIATVFAFLASDGAAAITGQNIVVDGGLTANLFVLETIPQP